MTADTTEDVGKHLFAVGWTPAGVAAQNVHWGISMQVFLKNKYNNHMTTILTLSMCSKESKSAYHICA